MKLKLSRSLGVAMAAAVTAGVAIVAAPAAQAAVIGSLTITPAGPGGFFTPFSQTTSNGCPLTATNFQTRISGPGIVGTVPINGNSTLASAGGVPGGGSFSVQFSKSFETIQQDNGAPLTNGVYTVELVCRIALNSTSLGEFTGQVAISGAGTGTDRVVTPVVASQATTTTLGATPASPQLEGTPIMLTAIVAPGAATGTVQFKDGGVNLGAAVAVSGGTASTSVTPAAGARSFTADFTGNTGFVNSTSNTVPFTVNPAPAAATKTLISGSTTGTVGIAQPIQVDVQRVSNSTALPGGAGQVQLSVDGVAVGAPQALTATGVVFQYTPAGTAAKVLSAAFTSSNLAAYLSSATTANLTTTATAPAFLPDPQTVIVTIPAGTLVISTPYTPANPFNLGTAVLNAAGTELSAQGNFGDPAVGATTGTTPADEISNGVTITDTRAGSFGWNASAASTTFSSGANSIAQSGLSFTNVTPKYLTGNALSPANPVSTTPIAAFTAAPQSFASKTAPGIGTVNITGLLKLTAPTSTPAGLYTATVTFTIV